MIPVNALLTAIREGIANASAIGLKTAEASELKVRPIIADFAKSPDLVFADLTMHDNGADTWDYDIRSVKSGNLPNGVDAISGNLVVVLPPLTDWAWRVTDGATDETIYGFALVNNANTTLLAVEKLPTPVRMTGVGTLYDHPKHVLELPPAAFVDDAA